MRNLKCKICGSDEEHEVVSVAEMMFGLGERFDYFQCSRCNCLQIVEIPADMSRYYPSHYYSFSPKPRKYLRNPIVRALRRMNDHYTVINRGVLGALVNAISPNKKLSALSHIALTERSRILDVGCGDGWRLYVLKEIGFEHVLGIDPYIQKDLQYENGVRIRKQSIHETGGEWDVIMYHHSFEHVSNPEEQLQTARQLLSRGGCCLIRIPTVSSYAWEQYRENWYQLDAPRHFFLHSRESMRILAEKSGFTLRGILFDSTMDQFLRSELYLRNMPAAPYARVFTKSQIRSWKRRATELNREGRGDQAAFFLIKK